MYDCPMHCAERDGHSEALREALNRLKSALEEQGRFLDLGSAADAERVESLVDALERRYEEAAARYRIHLEQHACTRPSCHPRKAGNAIESASILKE